MPLPLSYIYIARGRQWVCLTSMSARRRSLRSFRLRHATCVLSAYHASGRESTSRAENVDKPPPHALANFSLRGGGFYCQLFLQFPRFLCVCVFSRRARRFGSGAFLWQRNCRTETHPGEVLGGGGRLSGKGWKCVVQAVPRYL